MSCVDTNALKRGPMDGHDLWTDQCFLVGEPAKSRTNEKEHLHCPGPTVSLNSLVLDTTTRPLSHPTRVVSPGLNRPLTGRIRRAY